MKYFVPIFLLMVSSCASKPKVVECRPRPPVLQEDHPVAAQCSIEKNGTKYGVVFVYGRMPTDRAWEPELDPK